jgi:hypothetical protein
MRLLLSFALIATFASTFPGHVSALVDEEGLVKRGMVPRQFTRADGSQATVYINPSLNYVRSEALPSTSISKRSFKRSLSYLAGDRDQYCGETVAAEVFGASAPQASDCNAIAQYMTTLQTGYFVVEPADFDPGTGWCKVASSGSCSFAIKFQIAGDTTTALVGKSDIWFYISTTTRDAVAGRIGATGSISCYNGATLIDLTWGLIGS